MRHLNLFLLSAALAVLPVHFAAAEATHTRHKPAPAVEETLIPDIQPIVVTYDAYVGGIHLLTADVLFEEVAHKYHAQVKGQTYGVWYTLVPWNTELDAQGKIQGDRFFPAEYDTHDLWGKKAKAMKLSFLQSDVKAEYDPPEVDTSPDALKPEQKQGALDPVTALLQMLGHLAIQGNCNVTVPVFDGKRRFDVIATDDGTEYVDEDDYGLFKGDARKCEANFKAVAGEWTDKIKARFWKKGVEGEDREPFHIWLGQVSPDLPELAVRVETESAWGDIIVHLTKWRRAGPQDDLMTAPPVSNTASVTKPVPSFAEQAKQKGPTVADTPADK